MTRKSAVTSPTSAVAIMQAGELMPPIHVPLKEADIPFWNNVVGEKAKAEWSDHDLEIAALLARSLSRLENEETRLDSEETVLESAGGSPMQNPRLRVISDLHGRVIKYRQTLGIHNRGKNGEKRDTDKRSSIAKSIESDLSDNLLARPH